MMWPGTLALQQATRCRLLGKLRPRVTSAPMSAFRAIAGLHGIAKIALNERPCAAARSSLSSPRITIWNAAFSIGRCSALRLFPSATLEIADHYCRIEALPVRAIHHFPAEPLVEAHGMCSVKVNSRKFSLSGPIFYRSDQRGTYAFPPILWDNE